MKKQFLSILLLFLLLPIFGQNRGSFLKKEIYVPDYNFQVENLSLKDLSNIGYKRMKFERTREKLKFIKISFEKRELEKPVLCMPQTRFLYEIYSADSLIFRNFDKQYKLLYLQSYSSKPDLIELAEVPENIYVKIIDKSVPIFDINEINIGENKAIYNYAKKLNFVRLIIDQIFFYQGISLLLVGIPALIIFFVFREVRQNKSVLFFGSLSSIAGYVHFKLSAFSSYNHPFTVFDYSLVFISFILITFFLLLFIKYFFNLRSKRFYLYIVAFILTQLVISLVFKSHIFNRLGITFFNFILMGEIINVLLTQKKFSHRGKIVISVCFGAYFLLFILNTIFNLESYHMIFTPFGLGINFITIGMLYLLVEHYLRIYNERKEYELELSQLKQKNIEAELNSLKKQIDPHFLFNSLGTLSSLIEYSRETAENFVEELSNVYRYILQIQDKDLIPLNKEIKFAKSYLFLMKQRFQDNLRVTFDIDKNIENQFVIPAAIQILTENAVKHNKISAKYPLTIKLTNYDDNTLLIENKLQKKANTIKTEGIGLKNLEKRLSFFTKRKLKIVSKNDMFRVYLPLISEAE